MPPLPPDLRRQLERTVVEARDVSEAAAQAALQRLAVEEGEPFPHLKPEERTLRRQLRAKARQLGGVLDARTGRQDIHRLGHEVAYEHWHRMLFARFLAENHLLIHPDHGVPVTLQECKELAAEETATPGAGGKGGAKPDLWTVAGRFASRMLPQIFRPEDPALQVALAAEHRLKLEKLLEDLPSEIFTAEDGLGWVYQFWQSKRKQEVNASGDKITGETLPAVTQLFTEHYMVLFLLHNTIGAWWAGKVLASGAPVQLSQIPKSGASQSLDGKNGEEGEVSEDERRRRVALPGYGFEYLRFLSDGRPAAGTFPGWPTRAAELRILDPCCGSGHFLVAVFDLLVRVRMQEERLSARDACEAVLKDNVHGLELDARCTQIAAFALALAAWKFPDAGGYRNLPSVNVACSGLAVAGKKEEWLALANGDARLRAGLERLYDLFQQAPELGSLIDPHRAVRPGDLFEADFGSLQPLLEKALQKEKVKGDPQAVEMGVMAQGVAHAAEMLAAKYHLVITNVPYLGRGKQDEVIQECLLAHYPLGKADLATAFVLRCLEFCSQAATTALVTPQNWLFLTTYTSLRQMLLERCSWNLAARLGPGAFSTISGEIVNAALLVLSAAIRDGHAIAGLDVSDARKPEVKANLLRCMEGMEGGEVVLVAQSSQLRNPDARVTLADVPGFALLSKYAHGVHGLGSKDSPYFFRQFWELSERGCDWEFLQTTVEDTRTFGGMEQIVFWEQGRGTLCDRGSRGEAILAGGMAWNKKGILVSQIGELPCTLYLGDRFDKNAAVLLPYDDVLTAAIWCFASSSEFHQAIRQVDQTLKVTNITLVKVPFDLARWQKVAAARYPDGLPKPHSDDPTQWLFCGHPKGSEHPLQVAVARLVGYRWPRQTGSDFPDCPALGLDGLEAHADDDGIVCLPVVGKERPASERLRDLLAAACAKDWTPSKLDQLLAAVGFAAKSLDEWLHDGFFDQHCKLFHHRPFIWHIWDGRKDGFHALVNYHRLDRQLLDKLIYTYLGDWIRRQEEDAKRGAAGADVRLAAAKDLQGRLKLIADGEKPHDIFVRWKPLEAQAIGWEPDLNDGVRMNIRPFVEAEVLRKTPNVHWRKDRGKDPATAPWYHVFHGERINDHHLTLAEKRAAREAPTSRRKEKS